MPMYQSELHDHPEDIIESIRYAMNCVVTTMPHATREQHLRVLDRLIQTAKEAEPVPAVPAQTVVHTVTPLRHRGSLGFIKDPNMSIGIEDPNADHPVHHPNHYTAYKGLEIIDLTEQMNFNRGNAVKYVARAGLKDKATEIQDLQKAAWYINREIERLERG